MVSSSVSGVEQVLIQSAIQQQLDYPYLHLKDLKITLSIFIAHVPMVSHQPKSPAQLPALQNGRKNS